jgi:hypothetical protein
MKIDQNEETGKTTVVLDQGESFVGFATDGSYKGVLAREDNTSVGSATCAMVLFALKDEEMSNYITDKFTEWLNTEDENSAD